jgi:hypothetical protein
MSEAKDTPKAAGRGGAAAGAKGVVKDKPFDEAHDIGDDDLSSEGSVDTDDSEPSPQARASAAQASNAAAAAAAKSVHGRQC